MSTSSPIKHKPITMTPKAQAMFDRLSPQTLKPAFTKELLASPVEPTKVVARLESTVEGTCPYCQGPMRTSVAAGQTVWLCEKDRHVVPTRNAESA